MCYKLVHDIHNQTAIVSLSSATAPNQPSSTSCGTRNSRTIFADLGADRSFVGVSVFRALSHMYICRAMLTREVYGDNLQTYASIEIISDSKRKYSPDRSHSLAGASACDTWSNNYHLCANGTAEPRGGLALVSCLSLDPIIIPLLLLPNRLRQFQTQTVK